MTPEELAAIEGAVRAGLAGKNWKDDPMVAELWEVFAQVKRPELAAWRTEASRARHMLRYFGDRRCSSLSLLNVDEYRATRRAELTERGLRPTKASTRNREVMLLKRVLNFAVGRRLIPYNPIAAAPDEAERNIRTAKIGDEAQLAQLLSCSPPIVEALVLASYDAGMRRMEICGLRWDEIAEDGTVTLARRQKQIRPPPEALPNRTCSLRN